MLKLIDLSFFFFCGGDERRIERRREADHVEDKVRKRKVNECFPNSIIGGYNIH